MFSSAASQAGVPSPQDTAGPVSFHARLRPGLVAEAGRRTLVVARDHGLEGCQSQVPQTPSPSVPEASRRRPPDLQLWTVSPDTPTTS